MRNTLCVVLLVLGLPALSGCTTIKWMYSDKLTGEAWWIKHSPFASDQIAYCQPQTGGPVQCSTAELLDAPPATLPPTVAH